MPEAAQKALVDTGYVIADVSSQLSPYRTGNLSQSFQKTEAVQVINPGLVQVGTAVEYSPYVAAQNPFFEVAFAESASTYTEFMRREIQAEIDKNRV